MNEFVRAGSLQGQAGLDVSFYRGDVSQIIRENVVDQVRDKAGPAQPLPDIFESAELVHDGVVDRTPDQTPIEPEADPQDDTFGTTTARPTTLSSIEALLLDENRFRAPGEMADRDFDNVADKYVQNTDIQLNDASVYYEQKKSALEKALKASNK